MPKFPVLAKKDIVNWRELADHDSCWRNCWDEPLAYGRKILEEGSLYARNGRKGAAPVLKILNKEYPLKAKVVKLGGFSAHADQNELLSFLEKSNLDVKKIAVVHGEEDQSEAFAGLLGKRGYNAFVPRAGENYPVL